MTIDPDDVQLVEVSWSDPLGQPAPHLWIVAIPRRDALRAVLHVAPLGVSAYLRPERLTADRIAELKVKSRDVRDLGAVTLDQIEQEGLHERH